MGDSAGGALGEHEVNPQLSQLEEPAGQIDVFLIQVADRPVVVDSIAVYGPESVEEISDRLMVYEDFIPPSGLDPDGEVLMMDRIEEVLDYRGWLPGQPSRKTAD